MKNLTVKELIDIVDGQLIKGELELEIQHATPYIENIHSSNTLLFLLRKWKVNWELLYSNTPCIVITDRLFEELIKLEGCTVIQVADDDVAYQKFIDFYRNQFDLPVIAITGTSGKSTTVGMIDHILSQHLNVVSTKNSANGRTSHLMYLMKIDDSTQAAVFETAVGKPGDITNACRYFKPQIGIITNIGVHHLDDCKTIDGYIKAKGEMLTSIQENGKLIINLDDELTKKLPISTFKGHVITVGIKNKADFIAKDIRYGEDGMEFTLEYHGQSVELFVPGYGYHQVYNCLQAIAAINELGIDLKSIHHSLKTFKKLPLRLQVKRGINDCTLLNDTWNITTTSFVSALSTLEDLSNGKKKVVLIGELHKTGEYTDEIIHQYVEMIETYGKDINTLIAIGHTGKELINILISRNYQGKCYHFPSTDSVYDLLIQILDDQTIFLLKMTYEDSPSFINSLIEN